MLRAYQSAIIFYSSVIMDCDRRYEADKDAWCDRNLPCSISEVDRCNMCFALKKYRHRVLASMHCTSLLTSCYFSLYVALTYYSIQQLLNFFCSLWWWHYQAVVDSGGWSQGAYQYPWPGIGRTFGKDIFHQISPSGSRCVSFRLLRHDCASVGLG